MVSPGHVDEGEYGKEKRQDDGGDGDEVGLVLDPMAEEPEDQERGQRQQWNEFIGHRETLPFQQLKFVDIDRGLGSMQGNDDGQPDRNFRGRDRKGKEYEDLSDDIVKVLGERNEVDRKSVV